jgi:hypothetical protein
VDFMRMAPMDAAFASRDRFERRGHTNVFLAVRVQRSLTIDELRALVRDKWGSIARLDARMPSRPGAARWRMRNSDIDSRVVELSAAQHDDVTAVIARFVAEEFAPHGPLWQLALISGGPPGEIVLCLKNRHSLLDGLSMLALFRALLGGVEFDGTAEHEWTCTPGELVRGLGMFGQRICHPAASLPFQVPADGSRHVVNVSLDADIVDRITDEHPGASMNHIFLAAVSGAMRAVAIQSGSELPDRVYAAIPVATAFARSQQYQLGNHFVPLRIKLPVTAPDPRQRMRIIQARCKAEITKPRIRGAQAIMTLMSRLPTAMSRPLYRYGFSHIHFSLIASCLPDVTDVDAEEITAAPHVMGRVPLALVLIGPPRRLTITLVADAAAAPYAADLAAALTAELHQLAGDARDPAPAGAARDPAMTATR